MKFFTRIVSLWLAIFLFIGMFTVSADALQQRQLKTGIGFIRASALRLRSEPNSLSRTIDYGYADEVVVVLGKSGQWYHVIYNLSEGYMHETYLDVASRENAELGYGCVNADRVNVRSGPGTGFSSKGYAANGESVYIIGINETWFKVIWGDVIGYIRSDYVDLTQIPYENRDSENKPLFFVGGVSSGIAPSAAALKKETITASQILQTAKQYIGVPYLWGGTTTAGFDCSGYVQYVFNRHGLLLPRTSSQQWKVGQSVSRSALQAGDLVFFGTGTVNHVGIYMGNGQFIHASSSKGVTVSSLSGAYWSARYMGARRVIQS